jgi:hypothetical protein
MTSIDADERGTMVGTSRETTARPSSISYAFAFEPPLDRWARLCAVVPTRCYVRTDEHGFEAVFGLWRVATVWSNVVDVERTGPYTAWKVAGPAHVSFGDRGITMAATTRGGACLRFREPVRGIDPFGLIRHPGITLGVDDLDRFVDDVESRLRSAAVGGDASTAPHHAEGGYVGAARAMWRWSRRQVAETDRDVERIDMPRHDRADDADDQPVEVATGPLFHRRYSVRMCDASLDAEDAMAVVQADPNALADDRLAPFVKSRGESGSMAVGDRFVVAITGPWKGAVEVIEVTAHSFRLSSLEGHMESGVIDMRADDLDAGRVEFTIESWSRSHDTILHLMYDTLGIARALQSEMWSTALERFVAMAGGTQEGLLSIVTERAPAPRR